MSSTTNIMICFSTEELIDLAVNKVFSYERLHFAICARCFKRYCGLLLSVEQGRSMDVAIADAALKESRLAEIKELEGIYGKDSEAVDLAIRAALGGTEAIEI